MKLLVKMYLSLEKLVLNPVAWFSHRNWLVRYAAILLLISPVAIISAVTYQLLPGFGPNLAQLSSNTYQELISLRENFDTTTRNQAKEITELQIELNQLRSQLTANKLITLDLEADQSVSDSASDSSVVLAASNSATLPPNYISPSQIIRVVKGNATNVEVHAMPNTTSLVIDSLKSDSIHFYLTKADNWYQVDLENNQSGWIEARYVSELP